MGGSTNSQLSINPLEIGALGDRPAVQIAAQAVEAELDLLFEHAAQLARHPGGKKNRALPISRAKPQAVLIELSRISAVVGSCPDAMTEGYK